MSRKTLSVILALSGALGAGACDKVIQKSANPLTPTIAGPLSGVVFTPAASVQPAQNAQIKYLDQPVTFSFDAPTSTSPRPFTMRLQISTATAFTETVFDRGGLELPSTGTRVTLRLSDRLAAGVYYWRVRAEDGANNSDWSGPSAFQALEPVVIGAPTPVSPINNVRVTTRSPDLVVSNAASSGPHKAIQYQFQGSTDAAFATTLADVVVGEMSGQTRVAVNGLLAYNTTYYWRVRAGDGETISNWSPIAAFITPVAPPPTPTPIPTPPGTGTCAGNNGAAIVACIAAKYPDRVAAGVSASQRSDNLAFLRDRIIEAGLCGGLDLGWNLKRGGPTLSLDFLAEQVNGTVIGHDFAFDSDNTATVLHLYWGDGVGPVYAKYTNAFTCGG
jgi:hypothetical protein